eukprot:jgi/Mesen1/8144/ME000438S07251
MHLVQDADQIQGAGEGAVREEDQVLDEGQVRGTQQQAGPQRGRSTSVTLVIATSMDIASINPASELLAMGGWQEGPRVEGLATWRNRSVRLWQLETHLVREDHLDARWQAATGDHVKEIIFMSRHVAASSRPALTVHPIGVPHLSPSERPPAGGLGGWAAPPCTRIASWLRLLMATAGASGLLPEFEVTLEATHHGPLTLSPAMFVEIGSCPEFWGRADAARAIAKTFWVGLGLDGGPGEGAWDTEVAAETGSGLGEGVQDAEAAERTVGIPVMVGIGGGHYAPRHQDIAKKPGVWIGHLISSYTLPMEDPTPLAPSLPARHLAALNKASSPAPAFHAPASSTSAPSSSTSAPSTSALPASAPANRSVSASQPGQTGRQSTAAAEELSEESTRDSGSESKSKSKSKLEPVSSSDSSATVKDTKTKISNGERNRSSSSSGGSPEEIGGRWKDVIRTAVSTTQEAFPGGRVLLHLDAKSFKSWQRSAITRFCLEEGLPLGKPSDFVTASSASQRVKVDAHT